VALVNVIAPQSLASGTGAGAASSVLTVDPPSAHARAVHVRHLDPALLSNLGQGEGAQQRLRRALRVSVARSGLADDPELPSIAGSYAIGHRTLSFMPHFPFAAGVPYQAVFDPRELGIAEPLPVQTLAFEQPAPEGAAPSVLAVYPSAASVPANLLRLYVRFATPMQRGAAATAITLLDADGRAMEDVLYRAPVELWDPGMRCLTVMLDPGRLKRGVGPNRALGPPLVVGSEVVLQIGVDLRDAAGRPLGTIHQQRYSVTEAVREPIALRDWIVAKPPVATNTPLSLTFPRPLDWAMLRYSIRVFAGAAAVAGSVATDKGETHWRFTPFSPWEAGDYRIEVVIDLEDPCGNDLLAAFDRQFGPAGARENEAVSTITFTLA
jgi:hypothetical protein